MSLGFPQLKLDVDARAGQLALTVRDSLTDVLAFKSWLDTKSDASLIALGYVQGEVDTLRSAYVDLAQLGAVYQGTGVRLLAYDYRTFAKLLTGVV